MREEMSCSYCGRVADYPMESYEVGDRVLVLGCLRDHSLTIGIKEIVEIDEEAMIAYVDNSHNEGWWPCHIIHLSDKEYQDAVNILGEEYFA